MILLRLKTCTIIMTLVVHEFRNSHDEAAPLFSPRFVVVQTHVVSICSCADFKSCGLIHSVFLDLRYTYCSMLLT